LKGGHKPARAPLRAAQTVTPAFPSFLRAK
jgi:hypothetical protein